MAIPPGPYYPTSALVVVAWLGQRVAGITPSMAATKLPRETDWSDLGFIKVTMIPGALEVDVMIRHAMAQIDCYGITLNADGSSSAKPAVMKATRLAELVLRATEDDAQRPFFGKPIEMPTSYAPARVQAAYALTDPVEIFDDPSGYGRVSFDLALDWVRV